MSAELLDLHHRQDRLQQRDQDDAGDSPEVVAAPAEDRGAAQHDRGDRRQQIGIAHRLRGLARIASEQDAAERRESARDGERRDHHGASARAREIGGALAVAYRIHDAAERGAREQEDGSGTDERPNNERIGDTEEGVAGREESHRRRR